MSGTTFSDVCDRLLSNNSLLKIIMCPPGDLWLVWISRDSFESHRSTIMYIADDSELFPLELFIVQCLQTLSMLFWVIGVTKD